MQAILEVHGVAKRFGAVVAASDINVKVGPGERVGLIGSNGAGKTTFVNMITGYLKPDEGKIRLAGTDITHLTPRAINAFGVARSFQIPQLFGELPVLENMLVALACRDGRSSFLRSGRDSRRVGQADELLRRFRLLEHRDRRVSELPGGVRKLLDIAMALTVRPKLLLLDEPTSAVAADEKFQMMETIMSALQEDSDTPVLFVEHDMEIIARHATRVIAFYSGRIIADDVPGAVLAQDDVRRYVTGELSVE
ncbi:ABC transporter ATP-binding protein [Variovorax boronicumulans]|uniref:ABC transporter ATP-binding protein n=1 Tax=Variovorax boronicumulans TaxID=436515 RepID=UPI00085C2AA1|nr:ABC transporter ATP-binding protein [Variovorax boronicumulans]OEZ27405.1 ABC transporter ATP-binding protein [Variovorax boronicumulans]